MCPSSVKDRIAAKDAQEARRLNPRYLDAYIHVRMLDEMYDGRTLTKVLYRKLQKRLYGGPRSRIEAVAFYNGLTVFDRKELHGGGLSFGQDFGRVLLQFGLKRSGRLFEFCAGPGYIGYSLLASGFCEQLVLADVNPLAVAVAKHTAQYNEIEHLVTVYLSDVLDGIPAGERWDLVVGNPPHYLQEGADDNDIRSVDPEWSIHRRFYASVGRFMRPGGHVVMMENARNSSVELFEPMIRAGGGRIAATLPGTDVSGRENGLYYLMSQW